MQPSSCLWESTQPLLGYAYILGCMEIILRLRFAIHQWLRTKAIGLVAKVASSLSFIRDLNMESVGLSTVLAWRLCSKLESLVGRMIFGIPSEVCLIEWSRILIGMVTAAAVRMPSVDTSPKCLTILHNNSRSRSSRRSSAMDFHPGSSWSIYHTTVPTEGHSAAKDGSYFLVHAKWPLFS